MTRRALLVAAGLPAAAAAPSGRQPAAVPHFNLSRDTYLIDEPIPITVSGLPPHAPVTIRLRGGSPPDASGDDDVPGGALLDREPRTRARIPGVTCWRFWTNSWLIEQARPRGADGHTA